MESQSFIFYAVCMVNIWAYRVDIQLYGQQNFTGSLWQGNSTKKCTNIHTSLHAEVHSIRTNTCFIAYEHPHCKSRWRMKFMPGDINLSENKITYAFSFHACNDEEGGNQLNVDITNYYAWDILGYPDVVQSYKNVCSCVNIPKYLQNKKEWSINNHHNAMLVYYEPDCSEHKWSSKFMAAGHSYSSKYMHFHKHTEYETKLTHKVHSFGPDPNSPYFRKSCSSSNNLNRNLELVGRKRTENFESSTKSVTSQADDVQRQIQMIFNKAGELQASYVHAITMLTMKVNSTKSKMRCL